MFNNLLLVGGGDNRIAEDKLYSAICLKKQIAEHRSEL
jgi:hypothetical protein